MKKSQVKNDKIYKDNKYDEKKIIQEYKSKERKIKKDLGPKIFLDKKNDFVSIRIAPGIEAKSYKRSGFVFLEDSKGRVIEIQILNLSHLAENLS